MALNSVIGTIGDVQSRRYAVGAEGAGAQAIVMFYPGYAGATDTNINLYPFRVYQWPRATISKVFLGTHVKDSSNTVTEVDPSLVQDNAFCFGCNNGENPVLDVSGTWPYILIVLDDIKFIRVVSIVGDPYYT